MTMGRIGVVCASIVAQKNIVTSSCAANLWGFPKIKKLQYFGLILEFLKTPSLLVLVARTNSDNYYHCRFLTGDRQYIIKPVVIVFSVVVIFSTPTAVWCSKILPSHAFFACTKYPSPGSMYTYSCVMRPQLPIRS